MTTELIKADIAAKRLNTLKSLTGFERDILPKMTDSERGQLISYQSCLMVMNYKIFKRQMIDKYKPDAN